MKLTILGGGGFRTPLVYGALLARRERLGVDELWLHDLDDQRLQRVAAVLGGLQEEHGTALPFRTTTDLGEALEGADSVFCAIRVGGLDGRVLDEAIPLDQGVLGQETTGPGGICYALRTVPVMMEIAEATRKHAPNAWFINFTNPAGLVTEAIQRVLGPRAIGICDSPSSLCRRVAHVLDRPAEDLWFDYFGLNHLGWLRAVRDGGEDRLPELLADDARLESFEEGALFGGEWLRTIRMIPNEYLLYYYFNSDTVEAIRRHRETRAQFLRDQQAVFYEGNGQGPRDALRSWRDTRHARERSYMAEGRRAVGGDDVPPERPGSSVGGYEGVAMGVIEAIALNTRATLILTVANRSSMPFLDEAAVVEVPCVVGSSGAEPIAIGDVPGHAKGLIQTVKDIERTTIEAALTGSEELAVKAIALHPVVPSVATARRIFRAYADRQPALAGRFR